MFTSIYVSRYVPVNTKHLYNICTMLYNCYKNVLFVGFRLASQGSNILSYTRQEVISGDNFSTLFNTHKINHFERTSKQMLYKCFVFTGNAYLITDRDDFLSVVKNKI